VPEGEGSEVTHICICIYIYIYMYVCKYM